MFFSTRADGKVVEGLSALPVGQGPVLLVGNHQTLAFDLGVLIDEVLRETGVLMRGLAHPLAFQMMDRAEKDEGPVQAQGQARRRVHCLSPIPFRHRSAPRDWPGAAILSPRYSAPARIL